MTDHIFKGGSSGGARDTNIAQGRGVRSKLKLGGGFGFQGHFFIKKRAPSSKFIYGRYTTQLSLKLLNSECL